MHPDVNEVVRSLSQGIQSSLDDNLVGLYLCGSLSYGDFNPLSSDIDLVAILRTPASVRELDAISELHMREGQKYPDWARRTDCSYTPIGMLPNLLPPEQPRPYYGEGVFYPEALYGNEWIINLYLQYQHGITLTGPDFKRLISPINIIEVRKACIRDLFQEWQPKVTDANWLNNSHYQSYVVLNLCRILYTVMRGATGSKKVSAAWVKREYSEWAALVQTAEKWHYGIEMNRQAETIEFIRFAVHQVMTTDLYQQINSNDAADKR